MTAGLPKKELSVFCTRFRLTVCAFIGHTPFFCCRRVGDSMLVDGIQWALERGIEGLTIRHNLLADNIANVETPGFKRSDVAFKAQLAEAMGRDGRRLPLAATHRSHLGRPAGVHDYRPQVFQDSSTTMRADGNNVDIDREMAELARNTLEYQALVDVAARRLALLRTAITEGRR